MHRGKPYHSKPLPELVEEARRIRSRVQISEIPITHMVTKSKVVSNARGIHFSRVTSGNIVNNIQNDVVPFSAEKIGTDTFSGVTNPRWKYQIRTGQNATTVANGVHTEVENGWYNYEYNAQTRNANPALITFIVEEAWGHPSLGSPTQTLPTASQVTSVRNRAIAKFLDAADAARSSIEAGQDLGEYHQTVRGVTAPLSSLRNHVLGYFKDVKKLSFKYKQAIALEKAIADTYLEWHFGWRPLAEDIALGVEGIRNNSYPVIIPIHGGAKLDYLGSDVDTGHPISLPGGSIQSTGHTVSTHSTTVRYKGAVRTSCGSDGSVRKAQVLQLDLPHFVPTLWDLIPYSFIVDYFVNIGDIVRAFSFRTQDIIWTCLTNRVVHTDMYKFGCSEIQPGTVQVNSFLRADSSAKVTVTSFDRSPVPPSSLVPELQFHLPLKSTPWVNMAAIMTSRISELRPLLLQGIKNSR
jgi:hypothetical protein